MQSEQQSFDGRRWLAWTLGLGFGGATLTVAALFLSGLLAQVVLGGRVVRASTATILIGLLGLTLLVIGLAGFWLLRHWWGMQRSWVLVMMWWIVFFGLAFIGQVLGGLSLGVYLAVWLVIGAAGGFFTRTWQSERSSHQRVAPLGMIEIAERTTERQVLRSSEFGRIPPETLSLLSAHVQLAQSTAALIPATVPATFRDVTAGLVLDAVLHDWWANNNRQGLSPLDQADMTAFVQLAWQQASRQRSAELALVVFTTVLAALLDDWFAHWNADGVQGAPSWQGGA